MSTQLISERVAAGHRSLRANPSRIGPADDARPVSAGSFCSPIGSLFCNPEAQGFWWCSRAAAARSSVGGGLRDVRRARRARGPRGGGALMEPPQSTSTGSSRPGSCSSGSASRPRPGGEEIWSRRPLAGVPVAGPALRAGRADGPVMVFTPTRRSTWLPTALGSDYDAGRAAELGLVRQLHHTAWRLRAVGTCVSGTRS